jgi:hypothetical protein
MAYRQPADTSSPWLPASMQGHIGPRLGTAYGEYTFPLPHGGMADWRKSLSGFYQQDSFVLPHGQWPHTRRRAASSCCCPETQGNPTPSKMATKMAQSIAAPAAPVFRLPADVGPPDQGCGSLAAGITTGVLLLWGAYQLLKMKD